MKIVWLFIFILPSCCINPEHKHYCQRITRYQGSPEIDARCPKQAAERKANEDGWLKSYRVKNHLEEKCDCCKLNPNQVQAR